MKRIAYFHIFGGPPIERSVAEMLRAAFPELEVQPIQVLGLVRKSRATALVNLFRALSALRSPTLRELKRAYMRTPYLFDAVKRLAAAEIAACAQHYAFSFQLQSLFDTSYPGLAHFVYTDHTHLANLAYPGFERAHLNSPQWIARERQVYHNATHLFTRSTNITRSLIEDYGCAADQITCVGAGSNAPVPDRLAQPGTGKRVLFVGSDWERKGGPALVAAFAIVLQRHPDASLTIVGCEPDVTLPNCEVVGRVPVEDIGHYYRAADVFCLPTLNEPFGVVFVEAMAYGLPIVATRVGALPDLVTPGENGDLVATGDPVALGNTLAELLDAPDKLRRYGENSANKVASAYNWQSVGSAIRAEIIRRLPPASLGEPNRSRPEE